MPDPERTRRSTCWVGSQPASQSGMWICGIVSLFVFLAELLHGKIKWGLGLTIVSVLSTGTRVASLMR